MKKHYKHVNNVNNDSIFTFSQEVPSFSIYFQHLCFHQVTGFNTSCILWNLYIVTATFVFCLPLHTQSSYIHEITTSDDKNTTVGFLSIFITSNSIVNTKFQLLKPTMPYVWHSLTDQPVKGFICVFCVNISIGITTVLYIEEKLTVRN